MADRLGNHLVGGWVAREEGVGAKNGVAGGGADVDDRETVGGKRLHAQVNDPVGNARHRRKRHTRKRREQGGVGPQVGERATEGGLQNAWRQNVSQGNSGRWLGGVGGHVGGRKPV